MNELIFWVKYFNKTSMNDVFTDPDIQKTWKIQFQDHFFDTVMVLLCPFWSFKPSVLFKTNCIKWAICVLQKKQNHIKSLQNFLLSFWWTTPLTTPSLNTHICFSLSPLSLSASANLFSRFLPLFCYCLLLWPLL